MYVCLERPEGDSRSIKYLYQKWLRGYETNLIPGSYPFENTLLNQVGKSIILNLPLVFLSLSIQPNHRVEG